MASDLNTFHSFEIENELIIKKNLIVGEEEEQNTGNITLKKIISNRKKDAIGVDNGDYYGNYIDISGSALWIPRGAGRPQEWEDWSNGSEKTIHAKPGMIMYDTTINQFIGVVESESGLIGSTDDQGNNIISKPIWTGLGGVASTDQKTKIEAKNDDASPLHGLHFYTNDVSRMNITQNGHVGIGTNNPSSKRGLEIQTTVNNYDDNAFLENYSLIISGYNDGTSQSTYGRGIAFDLHAEEDAVGRTPGGVILYEEDLRATSMNKTGKLHFKLKKTGINDKCQTIMTIAREPYLDGGRVGINQKNPVGILEIRHHDTELTGNIGSRTLWTPTLIVNGNNSNDNTNSSTIFLNTLEPKPAFMHGWIIDARGTVGNIPEFRLRQLMGGSGGLTRLFIAGNGNVGIGKEQNLVRELDVSGSINFSGNLYKNGEEFSSGAFTISGNDAYYNNGKVGIGTDNPKVILHIKTTSEPRIRVESNANGRAGIDLLESDKSDDTPQYGGGLIYDGNRDELILRTYNNDAIEDALVMNRENDKIYFPSANVGIGTNSPDQKLHVAGNVVVTQDITVYYSDERLKTFKGKITEPLAKIKQINGYYFVENELAKSLGYNNDKLQVGVSAQEVEKVLPEIVTKAPIDHKYKTIWYQKLTPLLIEGIKEQQTQMEQQQTQIEQQQTQIEQQQTQIESLQEQINELKALIIK